MSTQVFHCQSNTLASLRNCSIVMYVSRIIETNTRVIELFVEYYKGSRIIC